MGAPSETFRVRVLQSGLTRWEAEGRLCGCTDLPMSASPCRAGSEIPEGETPDLVLTGPESAARSRAEAIAEATGARLKVSDALASVDLGLWEGLLESEAEARFPAAYGLWRENPASVVPPEGEELAAAYERLVSGFAGLCSRVGDDVLVYVVLRPLAAGLLRAWLVGDDASRLWEMVEALREGEVLRVSRARVRAARGGSIASRGVR